MPRNQDHLTTDSDTPRPGSLPPQQAPQDGPPIEAVEDGPPPSEAPKSPPPPAKTNQEKPTLRVSSPGNERRAEIMKVKRSEMEKDSEKLEDIIGQENVNTAKYGKTVADRMAAEEALAEADQSGKTSDEDEAVTPPKKGVSEPTEAKAHGNKTVEIKVNRKLIPVAMRDLRAVLVENGVDPSDLPDAVVIKSAQTMLAARDRLNEAKRGAPEEDAEGEEPKGKKQEPFNLMAAMKAAMEEQMYGDPDKAAAMMAEAVTTISAGASAHLMERRDTEMQQSSTQSEMQKAQLEFENRDDFKGFVKAKGRPAVNTALAIEGVSYLTEVLSNYVDSQEIDLSDPDTRGRVYTDLRRQGVALPSEADIVRQAHKRALTLYGALRGGNQNQPAVNLSPERQARREAVSPQPRAANAAASPIAQPKSRSDVVLEMQRARPR